MIQNHFYDKKEVSKELGIGASGGIRPNKRKNLVVLFFDSHPIRKVTDYGRNIYQDYFDEQQVYTIIRDKGRRVINYS